MRPPTEVRQPQPGLDMPGESRVLAVLWPAFLMAGVLEMLVFAVVDPRQLHWFGAAPIEWPVQAVYTVSFFIFWGVIAASGAITMLLERAPRQPS